MLSIHAHPDDESSKGAATLAHYVADGADVLVVSCTGGERGDLLNQGLLETAPAEAAMAERDLGGLRRIEMERARSIIGYNHLWLGYEDSGMPDDGVALPPNCFALIPLEVSAEPLVRIIRDFRPHVVITYDENGGYPHPDHIRTHEVTMFALDAAADPSRYPDAGEPWVVNKVYYDRIFNGPRVTAMLDAMRAEHPDSPLLPELERYAAWVQERPDRATTHVEVGEYFDQRDAALRCHASQVAPDSSFFFWPNELQRAAWPWEDFELARSTIGRELPEDDLFAGITPDTTAGSSA
ncbi:MAG TPA: mycothiol conjugate amidase Mca [Terrimesophilobacter sp.]|nr:mycothiol conjugate amidase Mca [Terrimesophilobacter sp.]